MLAKLQFTKPFSLLFWVFGAICLASTFLAISTESYVLFLLPAALLVAFISIADVKNLFYLLFLSIPISSNIKIGGGFSIDLPSEPIMLALTGICILLLLKNGKGIQKSFFTHPISLLLFAHFAWIFISIFFSLNAFVSIKYFLAKTWYIFTFYILAGLLFKSTDFVKKIISWFSISLFITVLIILYRHSQHSFSFSEVNYILSPFYSNHVAYASIMAVSFPFIFYSRKWFAPYSRKWIYFSLFSIILVFAIYFSYTRAAFAAIFFLLPTYFVIRWRLTKIVFLSGIFMLILFFGLMINKNTFMAYAPDFETTVTHTNYDNLLEATLKGQDISTMERFYRWVAGLHMINERPFQGYGPGNFYNFYESYTLSSFETYVSDNPSKSGIHNYFLMVLVEQGVFGLLIFLIFSFVIFAKGEELYHKLKDPNKRNLVMASMMSLVVIFSLLLMNDMIETDKVGSFFFLNLAILVKLDVENLEKLS